MSLTALKERYAKYGQSHAVKHLVEGDDISDFVDVPLEHLASWHAQATGKQPESSAVGNIGPFSGTVRSATKDDTESSAARSLGIEAVKNGQVAALVLAGGQGTRLGYDGPKGMFPLWNDGKTTLFSLLAQRLLKLSKLAGCSNDSTIPLYIMTSPLNDTATRQYWKDNNNFGLSTVVFFSQQLLPCLTPNAPAQLILETPTRLARAPDGNGGVYTALPVDDLRSRQVQYVHAFAIDNCLTLPADPVVCGMAMIEKAADIANVVVWKRDPEERVGVLAETMPDRKPCIVEYSELSTEMAQMRNDENKLVYGAANICNHWYTVDCLERLQTSLPYHAAHKKIPYWNGSATVTPSDENNAVKLETFIFDAFSHAKNLVVVEVDRADQFSPVKNAIGKDSPSSARDHWDARNRRWLTKAGATLVGTGSCDIAPETSYAGEGLVKIVAEKEGGQFELPVVL